MLVRSLTFLAFLLILNPYAAGQDYFLTGSKAMNRTGAFSLQEALTEESKDSAKDESEDAAQEDAAQEDAAQEDAAQEEAEEPAKEEKESTPAYFSIFEGLEPEETNLGAENETRRLPVVVEETVKPGEKASEKKFEKLNYFATYDKGLAFLPYDKKKNSFDMKINGWIQFRHHGFARNVDNWTDNAGVTRTVRNRNAFDIERARLSFKGSALDRRLTYFYQLDGDTDGRHGVDFFDYWWAWKFSDRFNVQFGKRKVSASRQWLLGARRTRFIDRPMANDFSVLTEPSVFGGEARLVKPGATKP